MFLDGDIHMQSLRDEFYTQLGLPRPRKTEPEEVRLRWKGMLLTLKQGNSWRVEHSSDTIDPWGSAAVHHSIARAMYGLRFNKDSAITLNLKQTAFFFHNVRHDALLMIIKLLEGVFKWLLVS